MYPVGATVPDAGGGANINQRRRREADLLGQLAPCRRFGSLAAPDRAAWKIPFDPIGRAHQQQRPAGIDRHKSTFMLPASQPPPDAGERETKAERCPPSKVKKRERRNLPRV